MAFEAGAGGSGGGTIVDANIVGCFGCGYCNIGCKFGKKLSMLDTVLPWAQQSTPVRCGSYEVQGAADPMVTGIRRRRSSRKLREGGDVEIRANERIIVPPGRSASSLLLQAAAPGMPAWASTQLQHGHAY